MRSWVKFNTLITTIAVALFAVFHMGFDWSVADAIIAVVFSLIACGFVDYLMLRRTLREKYWTWMWAGNWTLSDSAEAVYAANGYVLVPALVHETLVHYDRSLPDYDRSGKVRIAQGFNLPTIGFFLAFALTGSWWWSLPVLATLLTAQWIIAYAAPDIHPSCAAAHTN